MRDNNSDLSRRHAPTPQEVWEGAWLARMIMSPPRSVILNIQIKGKVKKGKKSITDVATQPTLNYAHKKKELFQVIFHLTAVSCGLFAIRRFTARPF